MTTTDAGLMRIRGGAVDGLLAGIDLHLEVSDGAGAWIPLRCVTHVQIEIKPDAMVGAVIRVELSALTLEGIPMDAVLVRFHEPASIIDRLRYIALRWINRLVPRRRP